MFRKFLLLAGLLIFLTNFAYTQEENSAEEENTEKNLNVRPNFWIGFGFNTGFYDPAGISLIGGNLAFGYGSGVSIGFMASYFLNSHTNVLELDLLLRFYLLGKNASLGPFLQVVGGASLVNRKLDIIIPAETGIFNAGLGFGWRLIGFNKFYWEPSIRAGYPYYCIIAISVGIGI